MPEKEKSSSNTAVAEPKSSVRKKTDQLPPYNVVLLDDDEHTIEYVMEMLQSVFGHPPEKGYLLAQEVDETGRVIVLTTHREKAELKRDQVFAYGMDPRVPICSGSMTAVIEPAMVQ